MCSCLVEPRPAQSAETKKNEYNKRRSHYGAARKVVSSHLKMWSDIPFILHINCILDLIPEQSFLCFIYFVTQSLFNRLWPLWHKCPLITSGNITASKENCISFWSVTRVFLCLVTHQFQPELSLWPKLELGFICTFFFLLFFFFQETFFKVRVNVACFKLCFTLICNSACRTGPKKLLYNAVFITCVPLLFPSQWIFCVPPAFTNEALVSTVCATLYSLCFSGKKQLRWKKTIISF